MTREETINMLKSKMDGHTDTSYEWAETVRMAIKALEQEPCADAISRQSAIFLANDLKQDLPDDERIADMVMAHNEGILEYQTQLSLLPPVTPQPKMGCEGCTYEKTGNNSTYPCSHCSRCYTDKYKVERNGEE